MNNTFRDHFQFKYFSISEGLVEKNNLFIYAINNLFIYAINI